MTGPFSTAAGSHRPPGASWSPASTNFCVYSRQAAGVELLLYADAEASTPLQVIPLDPRTNRSFFFWHVAVRELPVGMLYNWRVTLPAGIPGSLPASLAASATGPLQLEVLDPLCRAVSDRHWDRRATAGAPGSAPGLRGIVTRPPDRSAPRPPPRSLDNAIIYELHVGGFTRHPSSGVSQPGTWAGLIEKIPYLRDLGITHVQLLPVAAFDAQDVPDPVAAKGLRNYWGYAPHSLCSPHPGYSQNRDQASQTEEFRALVQALHAADIGVILDVVLNHTAEGGEHGPVINCKGLMPDIFYHHDQGMLRDYTGCGNTINCNHPLVTQMLLHALEVWVEEHGVDGFRFDLASVFVRGEDGEPLAHPPFPAAIEFSPKLAGVALIAEAWDAAGLYHVGNFPGVAWSEWNGRYRDVLRRFLRGDPGLAGELATRLAGSSDLYQASDRTPASSINYISCHDGFTLNDLVSYNSKHNEENGEDNRDGTDDNRSWNCGTEGPSDDPAVEKLRNRQVKNFLTVTVMSLGVPMFVMGDEVRRTQRGNNNAYCQDNEISWLNWSLNDEQRRMYRFVCRIAKIWRSHPVLQRRHFFQGRQIRGANVKDILWLTPGGTEMTDADWHAGFVRCLGVRLDGELLREVDERGKQIHGKTLMLLMNAHHKELPFTLYPTEPHERWTLLMDTAQLEPQRLSEQGGSCYLLQARSLAVFQLDRDLVGEAQRFWKRSVFGRSASVSRRRFIHRDLE